MQQQIRQPNAGASYDWANDHIYIKAPSAYTAGRVTLVEDTLKPGFHLARHYHKAMTESFYILEGEVVFVFDDERVVATPGTTLTIPPHIWHDVSCVQGGKLLTLFSPGGFEQYMEALAALSPAQLDDPARLQALAEQYDTWTA